MQYIKDITQLSENNQIREGFLYLILPFLLLGALSWFFPYLYALMPVPNSAICICQYFRYNELDLLFQNNFFVLLGMNIVSFYGVNFTFICSLIYMVWKIRKI